MPTASWNRLSLSTAHMLVMALVSASNLGLAIGDEPFTPPEYLLHRTGTAITVDGKLDEPAWVAAPSVGPFHFTWYKQGKKEQTFAKMLWDDEHLYVAHVCQDAHITARCSEHDGPVAKDDCFEVMIAPDPLRPSFYYNLEWNVIGGYVDGHRPEGPNGPRVPWDVEGVTIAGTYVGTLNEDVEFDRYWTVEVAIPLKNFAAQMPKSPPDAGYVWHLNLNRHGGDTNMQYSQWSPGDTPQPAFHTPHRFGRLLFSDAVSPVGFSFDSNSNE